MREKIAAKIVQAAEKAAYRTVGVSTRMGVYEIKPPKELLKKKREKENGSAV